MRDYFPPESLAAETTADAEIDTKEKVDTEGCSDERRPVTRFSSVDTGGHLAIRPASLRPGLHASAV
jgi:hypothetical protein